MIVLGLTGSIGMGKSTAAAQLRSLGAVIINADAIVHQLLSAGGVGVEPVRVVFPGAYQDGAIDRKILGEIVFFDDAKMKTLETLLHPLVVDEENRQLAQAQQAGHKLAVLEIPLLFETGAEKRCHAVVVVSAPRWIQKRRVLARPNMTAERFHRIEARQMPDHEKRRRAHFVVHTGLGRAYSFWQLKNIVRKLAHA